MHLDEETLERVLHRELDAERDAAARSHLSDCPECSAALEDSRRRERRAFELFELLDHEAPTLDWKAVEAARSPRSSRLLVAASLAAVLGAGILYALPDSPLRGWIDRSGTGVGRQEPRTGDTGSGAVSGLSIRPSSAFKIVFAGVQESGEVWVELADAPEIEIRVLGDPVALESGPDRVVVENRGSHSSYTLRLPMAGPAITIHVEDDPVLVKSGQEIRTSASRSGSGSYRIDLARPPH